MSVGSVIAADAVDVERERRCGGHEEESDKEARERVPKVLLHCCRRERDGKEEGEERGERRTNAIGGGGRREKVVWHCAYVCVCVCVCV